MTIVRCLDVETTGLPGPDNPPAGIMETGWCDLEIETGKVTNLQSRLVNCGIPTSIEARAVHHLSDDDVVGGIDPTQACIQLGTGPQEYYCAHNIDMEKAFFGGGDKAWLCTYKTALRVWPDAPGHKLQELRYWLCVDDEPDFMRAFCDRPHRAPDDAYVCAFVLRRLLAAETVDTLARWSNGPALLAMCWMKKHKGKTWQKVAYEDRPYLEWLYNSSDIKDRDIRATVKYWLNKTATN